TRVLLNGALPVSPDSELEAVVPPVAALVVKAFSSGRAPGQVTTFPGDTWSQGKADEMFAWLDESPVTQTPALDQNESAVSASDAAAPSAGAEQQGDLPGAPEDSAAE